MQTTTKTMKIARAAALSMLAEDYSCRVAELAERLRPRIESGELAPWDRWDERWEEHRRPTRGRRAPPGDRLEAICRRALARTFVDAYVVLAVSPSEQEIDGGLELHAARAAAGECIARDVLELGREQGWYAPPASAPREVAA